jgi:GNAT superfamily N-acetyltransferase
VMRIVPQAGGLTHKVVEVDNLVVRADQRGRRIGRRLLAAVVERSRQRRAVQVEAVVGEGDAKRFYESFGFAIANDRLVLAA